MVKIVRVADSCDSDPGNLKNGISLDEKEKDSFIRCRTCTLSLCTKHHNEPILLADNGKPVIPKGMVRKTKCSFFKCTLCASRGKTTKHVLNHNLKIPRSITSAKFLTTVFFDIVYSNRHIRNQLEQASLNSVSEDKEIESDAFNYVDVRTKIWKFRYGNIDSFKKDMVLAFENLARSDNENVIGSLDEFSSELRSSIKRRKKHYRVYHVSDEKVAKLHSLIRKRGLILSSALIPALHGEKIPLRYKKEKSSKATKERDLSKRETASEATQKASTVERDDVVDAVEALANMQEANVVKNSELKPVNIVALSSASEHAPPAEGEIAMMLETQGKFLRQALGNISLLKKAVSISSLYNQAGHSEVSEVLTLGEMNTVAELQLANRNLRRQLEDAQKQLVSERKARKIAEEEVERLKSEVAKLSSEH